ncbi:hypothetical protein LCGC14_2434070 [marine sediment metagenome]|uniref:Uncharacterized protein n=1 Tax=marine sediment metagenome TaxID=412755 RepID=A0A0F9BL56_9ZZZZ
MSVEHWDPAKDGPFSEEKFRKKLESSGYHVSRYHYAPGTYFPDHTHSVDINTPGCVILKFAFSSLNLPPCAP